MRDIIHYILYDDDEIDCVAFNHQTTPTLSTRRTKRPIAFLRSLQPHFYILNQLCLNMSCRILRRCAS